MTRGAAFRGQPLLLIAALLAAWLTMRMALWHSPFEATDAELGIAGVDESAVPTPGRVREPAGAAVVASSPSVGPVPPGDLVGREWSVPAPLEPVPPTRPFDGFGPAAEPVAAPAQDTPRAVIGHSLLLMAGLSQMEVPPALLAHIHGPRQGAPGIPAAAPMLAVAPPREPAAMPSRWTADAWLLLREDTASPLLPGRPSYGRSQAGAVIRYRLAPASPLRPQAYVRASAALGGPREQEVAAGVSARPLAGVPVRFAVEARVGETDRGSRVRPAAFAVTELPSLGLPLGMRAEAYAQGGYVGGDYATAFVDGSARIDRPLGRIGATEFSAGAGVWGGAQKGAARLDIGPSAAISFRLGPKSSGARGRVAADYRFRIAGDAEPSSGPALTLSAGF